MNNKFTKKANSSTKIAGLSVRQIAAKNLAKIFNGAPFIPISEKEIADGRDRALANKLINIALRRHGQIKYIIKQLIKRKLPKNSDIFTAQLFIAIGELLFLPRATEYSSIFVNVEAVKTNRKISYLSGLMNAILRNIQREKEKYISLSDELLFPNWLYKRWQKFYGAEKINSFSHSLLNSAPLDLVLKNENDEELIKKLNANKIFKDSFRIERRSLSVKNIYGFNEGSWWVQDIAASLAARLINLKKGSLILDMCAAPGGKSAQLIKQNYNLTALDIDEKRLEILRQNLKRINYSAKIELADSTIYHPKKLFDGVLLDAPCTASGTFRRHPEILFQRKKEDIFNRVKLQRDLIKNAIKLLKPNGLFIYVTCSLEREEGEEQANWILQNFAQISAYPIRKEEIMGFRQFIDENGYVRTLPIRNCFKNIAQNISGSMDGFFIARFRRK